jgi:hypothetical protein
MRLAEGDDRVDFGVRLGPSPAGRAALPHWIDRISSVDPRWEPLRRFAADWQDPRSLAARRVSMAFLEFDERPDGTVGVPSMFLGAHPTRSPDPAEWTTLLEGLRGRTAESPIAALVSRCIDALPRRSRLLQVGAMVGRQGAVRLFASIWRRHAVDFLKSIAYPGDVDRVVELHDRHADWCEGILLQLDLDGAVGARLGIEFDAQAPTEALRAAEWKELISRFVGSGLSAPEKADALLAWRRPASPGLLRRDISHLKLVYDGSAPVEAKAYVFEERRSGDGPQLARN